MGLHIARFIAATVNLLLGGLITWGMIESAREGWYSDSGSEAVINVCFALFGAVSLTAAALLVRRQTALAGLRVQIAQANLGFVLAFLTLAQSAWLNTDHRLYSWDFLLAYWCVGLSAVWLTVALAIKAVMQARIKQAAGAPQWETSAIASEVAPVTTSVTTLATERRAAAPEAEPLVLGRR